MSNKDIIKPLVMRQLFTLVVIILLGILIFTPMLPYISGIFGAIIMYVLTKGWMEKLVKRGWKRWLSAALMILTTILIIMLPITFIVFLLINRIKEVMQNSVKYTYILESNIAKFENYVGYDLTQSLQAGQLKDTAARLIESLAGNTLDFTIIFGLMYFSLYYMLINFDKIKEAVSGFVPLNPSNYDRVSQEAEEMVKSNAIAIPLVAILQGIVALIGFFIFGAPNPWFWFAVTTLGSMIPFVGTALGMVPVILIMYAQGGDWEAAGLAIYGVTIVGSTDNLFRMVLQKSLAEIHPMITLIGVIIGIPLFGFLGLIFGPLIVSLFLLLVKIYKEEYTNTNHQEIIH
ncbi:AI-2E family transporter [Flavobacteriaceae bacterium Ap0902]|nr:AI-2E family transporter [Flavobacteriaceae bacterium Ap0902]